MSKNSELYGLENKSLQSNSSKSLLGTISTGFSECNKATIELAKPDDLSKNFTIQVCDELCGEHVQVNENVIPQHNKLTTHPSSNEDSILTKVDTGFGDGQTLVTECKKPVYKTHLCKESYLSEFKSESEKTLARTNLDVYSKSETHLVIQETISDFITKNEFEESIKDLDYTTSRSKSQVNYKIPDNLFK